MMDSLRPRHSSLKGTWLLRNINRERTLRISVFDLKDYELYGTYTLPEKWGNSLASFSAADGFVFMAPEKGRYKFLEADFR